MNNGTQQLDNAQGGQITIGACYNQCFLSDCMAVMARYPDNYFDLALCDIPYGINVGNMAYLKETKTTVKQKNGTRLNGNAKKKSLYAKRLGLRTTNAGIL